MAAASFISSPVIVPYRLVLVFSTLLGLHGYRSGSLSKSGAIAAAVLGYATLASPLSVFGVALLSFYLAGSRATKVKAAYKATLEDQEHESTNPRRLSQEGSKAKAGGNRSATQVLCNAWLGTACAVAWRVLYSGELEQAGKVWNGRGSWCVLDDHQGPSRALVLGAVAFWAACAGDTFASELGILSSSSPILLTTLRPVPRGTNGGISAWGTLMSLAGGALVGVASAVALAWDLKGACSNRPGHWWMTETVGVGMASGVGGSMIDSLLGATLQQSLYSSTQKRIVHERSRGATADKKYDDDQDKSVINVPGSGWNLLSNNLVNLISSGGMAAAVMWWAR